LTDRIDGAEYCPSLEDTEARLRQLARPGDLILTVGAGNICTVGYRLVK
jgi:UDP-N-acetylmuramate--alanine ligase